MKRAHNFNPGPAALPMEVLQKIQQELLDYRGTGMSILEISHRSKEFEEALNVAKQRLHRIMGIPDNYEILFLGGGASLQFSMIPMNFLEESWEADYVITGSWSKKALKEAELYGKPRIAASSDKEKFSYIPSELALSPNAHYVHITSNNTIFGTQWQKYPDTGNVPLFVDMSSDILSRRVDVGKFSLIYAGAQKNMGPAGVTVVIMRKDLMTRAASRKLPAMLDFKTHLENNSLYNTPPVFPIYVVGLVAEWIEQIGGLEKLEEINSRKAKLLYDAIDAFPHFYKGTVRPDSRSSMNVTFRLPSEELEQKFIKEGKERSFIGLKGHRSVGGIRASLYNAVSMESVESLVDFMKKFVQANS